MVSNKPAHHGTLEASVKLWSLLALPLINSGGNKHKHRHKDMHCRPLKNAAPPQMDKWIWGKCDRMCHRSVNHSGIYLDPWAILDFSKGRPAWGKIYCERTALLLCHVLQTLLFIYLFFLLNRGLVFHCLNIYFCRHFGRKFLRLNKWAPWLEALCLQVVCLSRSIGAIFQECLQLFFFYHTFSAKPSRMNWWIVLSKRF